MSLWEKVREMFASEGLDIVAQNDKPKDKPIETIAPKQELSGVAAVPVNSNKKDITVNAVLETGVANDDRAAMVNKIADLERLITKEIENREAGIRVEQERLQRERTAAIEKRVEELFTGKVITEAQKEQWRALYASNYEAAEAAASTLPRIGAAVPGKDTAKHYAGFTGESKIMAAIAEHQKDAAIR